MSLAEALELARIPRFAGLTGDRTAFVTTRPCRAPQHTISEVSLIGGDHVPMPDDARTAYQGCVSTLPQVPASCRVAGRLALV
jgi:magnesium chelatase family protein